MSISAKVLSKMQPVPIKAWADFSDEDDDELLDWAEFAQEMYKLMKRTAVDSEGRTSFHFKINNMYISIMHSTVSVVVNITGEKKPLPVDARHALAEALDAQAESQTVYCAPPPTSSNREPSFVPSETKAPPTEKVPSSEASWTIVARSKPKNRPAGGKVFVFNDAALCPYMDFALTVDSERQLREYAQKVKYCHGYMPHSGQVLDFPDPERRGRCRRFRADRAYQFKFEQWNTKHRVAPPDTRKFEFYAESSSRFSSAFLARMVSLSKVREHAKHYPFSHAFCVQTREVYDFWVDGLKRFCQKRKTANPDYMARRSKLHHHHSTQ